MTTWKNTLRQIVSDNEVEIIIPRMKLVLQDYLHCLKPRIMQLLDINSQEVALEEPLYNYMGTDNLLDALHTKMLW